MVLTSSPIIPLSMSHHFSSIKSTYCPPMVASSLTGALTGGRFLNFCSNILLPASPGYRVCDHFCPTLSSQSPTNLSFSTRVRCQCMVILKNSPLLHFMLLTKVWSNLIAFPQLSLPHPQSVNLTILFYFCSPSTNNTNRPSRTQSSTQ